MRIEAMPARHARLRTFTSFQYPEDPTMSETMNRHDQPPADGGNRQHPSDKAATTSTTKAIPSRQKQRDIAGRPTTPTPKTARPATVRKHTAAVRPERPVITPFQASVKPSQTSAAPSTTTSTAASQPAPQREVRSGASLATSRPEARRARALKRKLPPIHRERDTAMAPTPSVGLGNHPIDDC